ncbi:type II toxin-antitoxin system HipA family toxin [Paraburkholderia sp. UCT31]|uniref:HipA domain-containing protein n=1 Tax=Paraburkholderia sp. UCT31 TaxID=2615209 RepID=UPI0016562C81|nr:HipA domain-containing protein [Paraburkholderia sp. UCT31]MBC8739820.1 type II toxin-antitoxin system HipA family toxin [Paraburkholderia sp. UCT31]
MATRTLFALADGRRVGTVLAENGIWSFEYDADWARADDAFALSPAFPLEGGKVIDGSNERPVQWFFDNLLPEEGMRAAMAREARTDGNDAWALLEYFGRESAGALTLLTDAQQEPAGGKSPLSFDVLEKRIQAMPQHALTAAARKRMAAAGAQQKALVILEGERPDYQLFEPEGAEPSMHILKPDMRAAGYPHSAINEFFCMQLAKEMGLNVPNTHFLRVPSACYVVDRFDRDTGTTPANRLHILDAVQLLGLDKSFKYREATGDSLAKCLEKVSTRAVARLSIFRWTVFNILIGNADAHLKNLSFFSTAKGYQLAPFYDLVSTVVYNTATYHEGGERWPQCALTMQTGQARHFNEITRDNVLVFAQALGMRPTGAKKELETFLTGLDGKVARVRQHVVEIAHPDAGETRLLNSIMHMPIAEMSKALRG